MTDQAYTAPFSVEGYGDFTVTAKATKAGMDDSALASTSFTLTAPMTLAEFLTAKPATATTISGPIQTIYQSGNYLWIQDATGTPGLIYDDSSLVTGKFETSKIISNLSGTFGEKSKLPYIKPVSLGEISDATEIIEPTVGTTAMVTNENMSKYLVIKNATLANGNKSTTLTDESGSITLYNQLSITYPTISSVNKYDVTGFVYLYNTTLEFVPVSVVEVYEPKGPKDFAFDGFKDYSLTESETAEWTIPEEAPLITFASSDESVAKADATGVSALAAGTATITATWDAVADIWNAGSATFTVTVKAVPVIYTPDATDTFELITDVKTLSDGDQIVIAEVGALASIAMSTVTNKNVTNYQETTVTIEDGTLSLTKDSTPIVLTLGIGEGSHPYTFTYAGKYLGCAESGKNNYLKAYEAEGDQTVASISITEAGVATIDFLGEEASNGDRFARTTLLHNVNSTCFACYDASTTNITKSDIGIYRLVPPMSVESIANLKENAPEKGKVEFLNDVKVYDVQGNVAYATDPATHHGLKIEGLSDVKVNDVLSGLKGKVARKAHNNANIDWYEYSLTGASHTSVVNETTDAVAVGVEFWEVAHEPWNYLHSYVVMDGVWFVKGTAAGEYFLEIRVPASSPKRAAANETVETRFPVNANGKQVELTNDESFVKLPGYLNFTEAGTPEFVLTANVDDNLVTSVEGVEAEEQQVMVVDGEIVVPQGAEVFTVGGVKVTARRGLQGGIYLVRLANGTVTKLLVK